MPARSAASPTAAASSGLNRTHTDLLRAASARGRRRDPDPLFGTWSLLVTTSSLTHASAALVPRRAFANVADRPPQLHR